MVLSIEGIKVFFWVKVLKDVLNKSHARTTWLIKFLKNFVTRKRYVKNCNETLIKPQKVSAAKTFHHEMMILFHLLSFLILFSYFVIVDARVRCFGYQRIIGFLNICLMPALQVNYLFSLFNQILLKNKDLLSLLLLLLLLLLS